MSSAMDSDSVNLGSNPSSPANKTCEDYGVLCVPPVLLDRSEPTKKANNAKRAPTKAGHKSVVGSFRSHRSSARTPDCFTHPLCDLIASERSHNVSSKWNRGE